MVVNQRVKQCIYKYLMHLQGLALLLATSVLLTGENGAFCDSKTIPKQKELTMFKKGQSGNPAGRRRKRVVDDYLKAAVLAKGGAAAKAIAQRVIGEALKGDIPAAKLIYERIGGKPRSAEEMAAQNGDELTLAQVRAKLAELLACPEVRRNLQAMLIESTGETVDAIDEVSQADLVKVPQ